MDDFVIIGGGVAGLSAAAALAPLGRTTLLEAEAHLGHHSSSRSAAVFLEHYGNDTTHALNRASAPHHRNAEVLTPRPMLLVARTGEDDAFHQALVEFDATEIPIAAAHALWPILDTDHVERAARYDGAEDIDTDRVMQGFAKTARGHGATLRTAAAVERIEPIPGGWHVTAGGERLKAAHLINAAGAWADRIAALAGLAGLGLQPFRRSMARLPAPGGRTTQDWPFVDAVTAAWYAKPDAGAWLVSPSEEDPVDPHDAWAEDMVIAEALDRYQACVTEPVTRVLTTWAGLRTFAPDRSLVVGPDPRAPRFWWCAGQGGYGFQTAPAVADLLADLAADRPPRLDSATVGALRPGRLIAP